MFRNRFTIHYFRNSTSSSFSRKVLATGGSFLYRYLFSSCLQSFFMFRAKPVRFFALTSVACTVFIRVRERVFLSRINWFNGRVCKKSSMVRKTELLVVLSNLASKVRICSGGTPKIEKALG